MYIEQLIAHMQENKYLYLLESKVKVGWFLLDCGFDEDTSLQLFMGTVPAKRPSDTAVVWFPDRQVAMKFDTEETIEEFQTFLARPSAIVRIETEEFLRRL